MGTCGTVACGVLWHVPQNTGNARRKIAATTVRGRDALAALRKVEELRQQRKFRGEVHGPVAMEVRCCAVFTIADVTRWHD